MSNTKQKPFQLGSIFAANAKIQVILGDRFVTIGQCMDTPNAIRKEAIRLHEEGIANYNQMWVIGTVTDRKMVMDL